MLDLRLPAGWFFILIGGLLCISHFAGATRPAPLADPAVNLYTGLVYLVFGGMFLWLARKKK